SCQESGRASFGGCTPPFLAVVTRGTNGDRAAARRGSRKPPRPRQSRCLTVDTACNASSQLAWSFAALARGVWSRRPERMPFAFLGPVASGQAQPLSKSPLKPHRRQHSSERASFAHCPEGVFHSILGGA